MIVSIKCVRSSCDNIVREEERTKPRKSILVGETLCSACRAEHISNMIERERSKERRESNSNRMKENNPMFNPETRAKVASTKTGEEKFADDYLIILKDVVRETREELSNRMKENNPMFNPETRSKTSKTFNDKIKSGEIVYKRGPEHHLWKGNRTFTQNVRSRLFYEWTLLILNRDGFICQECGCDNKKFLQVHHIKPFREFLKEALLENNLVNFFGLSDDAAYSICRQIIDKHKLEDGITLCVDCHRRIDPYYNGKTSRKRRRTYKRKTRK